MSYAFKTPPANPSFGVYNESLGAGEYILNKKAKTTFCNSNAQPNGPIVQSQGQQLLLNQAKLLNNFCSITPFNKSNLNMNLVSIFNSHGCCNVIAGEQTSDAFIHCTPTNIPYQPNNTTPFYQLYTIDPNGCLFGNNVCNSNNYLENITYNPPPV